MRSIVVACFVVLTALRVSLLGQGAWAFPDELRAKRSFLVVQAIASLDASEVFRHFAVSNARPGAVLVQAPPAAVDRLISNGEISQHPWAMWIFNVLCSLGASFFVYRIASQLLGDRRFALLALIWHGLLVNSNLYLRHMLPYDGSLVCLLGALDQALRSKRAVSAFAIGALAGLGLAIYPGYYWLALLVALGFSQQARVRRVAAYALGIALVLILFEGFARVGGGSYFGELSHLSETIDHGSFGEGFTYIFSYLWQVEGLSGALAVLACFAFTIRVAKERGPLRSLTFGFWAIVFAHGCLAAILHRQVLYGRILHAYLPVVFIVASASVMRILKGRAQTLTYVGVTAVSIAAFLGFSKSLAEVSYPKDVQARLKAIDFSRAELVSEWQGCRSELPAQRAVLDSRPPVAVFVNFCYFYPLGEGPVAWRDRFGSISLRILFEGQHFMGFKPYTFEEYGPENRHRLSVAQPRLVVAAP